MIELRLREVKQPVKGPTAGCSEARLGGTGAGRGGGMALMQGSGAGCPTRVFLGNTQNVFR